MFRKLRNKIIVITMTITTAVLLLAGGVIMLSASGMRPEPKPLPEPTEMEREGNDYNEEELKSYIELDRKEGDARLLVTLLSVGVITELAVFLLSYYLSQKIVEPVEEAYEKQKMFIANASHELKTPLAVIQANSEALSVDKDNKKWKKNIETEVTQANKLVADLLQLARMDAGNKDRTANEEFDLATEIKEHIEIFEPKFTGKFEFNVETKRKHFILPKQDLLQVLDILLDNATKYGERKITVRLTDESISVNNDGAVIKKEDTRKIFERFYQTDKTKEGSGLGLAIAKAVCEQNGWKIYCESSKNLIKFIIIF